jgi:hypothetical protein
MTRKAAVAPVAPEPTHWWVKVASAGWCHRGGHLVARGDWVWQHIRYETNSCEACLERCGVRRPPSPARPFVMVDDSNDVRARRAGKEEI